MTPGDALLLKLRQIAAIAAELPADAKVTVEWADAPPDLALTVALQRGGHLRTVPFVGGGEVSWGEWMCRGVLVRAHRAGALMSEGLKLRLVKP